MVVYPAARSSAGLGIHQGRPDVCIDRGIMGSFSASVYRGVVAVAKRRIQFVQPPFAEERRRSGSRKSGKVNCYVAWNRVRSCDCAHAVAFLFGQCVFYPPSQFGVETADLFACSNGSLQCAAAAVFLEGGDFCSACGIVGISRIMDIDVRAGAGGLFSFAETY